MTFLLKNSRGRPDFLMTAAALALGAAVVKFLLNAVVLGPVNCGTTDAALIGAILAPTFLAYTAKRIKGGKNDEEHKP